MSDLISRQAALNAIERLILPQAKGETAEEEINRVAWRCAINCAEEMIGHLPTIEAEPRWIPVTERLPEEDTEVLVSYRYKQGEGDTSHTEIDITSYGVVCFGGRAIHELKEWRQPFEYFHANYEVIAWMPLPEPYKGVGE